ncbi:POK9 protein, partial [Steatornis caripensis]|nr:POK9 protein [Steatornis caripensis]
SGSLGVDVATTVEETLLDRMTQLLPTGVYGPLKVNGQAVGALLLGRSSAALKGLTVIPGVIDADYTGEIKIMVKTDFPSLIIPKGSRIAQLVPLPQLLQGETTHFCGNQGFGSTGQPALFSLPLNSRPEMSVTLTYQSKSVIVRALLDSGADVTILS